MNSAHQSKRVCQHTGRAIFASWIVPLLLLLALPTALQAQFLLVTNDDNTLMLAQYTGPGGDVIIPSSTNGYPVTTIAMNTFINCMGLTGVIIPDSITRILGTSFSNCRNLTSVTIPDSVIMLGSDAFGGCVSLTNVVIGNAVPEIYDHTFAYTALTSVTIPNSVTNIDASAFQWCSRLTSVTIGTNLASLGDSAFDSCTNLTRVYFRGNAPSLGSSVFAGDTHATVYYLPGTTGWGPTFGGLPAVLWDPPAIQTSPQTQTAEVGAAVALRVKASGARPLSCRWYLNDTNFILCSTNCELELTNVQCAQSGAYTVVVSNACGAVTSSPAMLSAISPVPKGTVPAISVACSAGTYLHLVFADTPGPTARWQALDTLTLSTTQQFYADLTSPLPSSRFYRAWQANVPGAAPVLRMSQATRLPLTGTVGSRLRVDCINQFGPTDAWVTLDTVTLTNTIQSYFDFSMFGQPPRLYRVAQVP